MIYSKQNQKFIGTFEAGKICRFGSTKLQLGHNSDIQNVTFLLELSWTFPMNHLILL